MLGFRNRLSIRPTVGEVRVAPGAPGALPFTALSSSSIVLSVGAKTYKHNAEILALILHHPKDSEGPFLFSYFAFKL